MSRLSLLCGVAAVASIVAVSTAACAQTARDFNIPAGAMRSALTAFATQSDQQIFFTSDMVEGVRSPGVTGRLEPSVALDRVLQNTGLGWTQSRPGVFALRRLEELEVVELDEVVVTGTLLRSSGPPSSPVVTLDRASLDRRGLPTVADVLVDLPQNYAGSGTPGAALGLTDGSGSNSGLATGINLRGLGPDATLTLINGRRLAGSGFRGEFADVSALPSAAVERVDVLLDGASALYGSDAVAGVVNVIMRRSYEGQESRLHLGSADDGAESLIASHLAGRQWSSGSALISYEYQQTNGLNSQDRRYTADGDLRPFGGSDRRSVFSSPGNVLAFDPAIGGYVSQFAIRPGPDGSARSPQDFAAGQANLASQLRGVDLTPDVERHSLYGRARQSVGDRLDITADVRYSQRDFGFDNGATVTIFAVTPSNPYFVSPDGSQALLLGYSFFGDFGPTRQEGRAESFGITAGGVYDLGGGWSADGYLAFASERDETTTSGRVNSLFLEEALGNLPDDPRTTYSAARDGYFNPFGAGSANSADVLEFIGSGFSQATNESRAESANLLITGPAFSLPGGDLDIAVGAQVRRESFATETLTWIATVEPDAVITPRRKRTITALFAEARIPIVGEANARPGLQALEVSLAGRVEDYDDFGTTTNPKLGLVWKPASDLSVRASFGTSFRAPSLPQLFDDSAVTVTAAPRPDGSSVLALFRYGGNPDLQPETAETWAVGIDYAPARGVRGSVNLFETRFEDRIAQPVSENFNAVLTDPSLTPFVDLVDPANNAADLALVRGYTSDPTFPFGSIFPDTSYGAILDARWVNAEAVQVRGVDASVLYPLSLGAHEFTFDASASYILNYETQITPLAPARSVVGQVGFPVRLRGRAGFGWTFGSFGADVHWSHVAAYSDGNGREIEAWDTVDLQLGWNPALGRLSGSRLAVSVQNLFDADPPFYDAPTGFGFDPGQANPFGRMIALQLIKRW